jgi:hypothetical protein
MGRLSQIFKKRRGQIHSTSTPIRERTEKEDENRCEKEEKDNFEI